MLGLKNLLLRLLLRELRLSKVLARTQVATLPQRWNSGRCKNADFVRQKVQVQVVRVVARVGFLNYKLVTRLRDRRCEYQLAVLGLDLEEVLNLEVVHRNALHFRFWINESGQYLCTADMSRFFQLRVPFRHHTPDPTHALGLHLLARQARYHFLFRRRFQVVFPILHA